MLASTALHGPAIDRDPRQSAQVQPPASWNPSRRRRQGTGFNTANLSTRLAPFRDSDLCLLGSRRRLKVLEVEAPPAQILPRLSWDEDPVTWLVHELLYCCQVSE